MFALAAVPLLVVRLIGPVVPVAGAVALTDPKLGVEKVAVTPLNFTAESPSFKLAPVIVTVAPDEPKPGEKPEMLGLILKLPVENAVPAGAVTLIRPLFTPVGTVAERLRLSTIE